MNDKLAAIAAKQGGVFTRAQAKTAGYSLGAIAYRIRSGQWVPVRHGADAERTRFEAAAGDPHQRHRLEVAAALLRQPADAAAAGTSAGRLHRVTFIGGWPVAARITVPQDRRRRSRPSRPHTSWCRAAFA